MNEPLRIRVPGNTDSGGNAPDDASIPLLTERLSVPATLPPLDLDITLPPSVQRVKLDLPAVETAAPSTAEAAVPSSGAHWSRIEIELRESVLNTLAEQLPHDVEDIVRRHVSATADAALREIIEPLVARLTAETRLALASSLREIVDRAVKAELARLRTLKPRQ
jgi:hypothetical protein